MGNTKKGEARSNSKLDADKVKEMRRLNVESGFGKKKLAKLFDVSESVARRIIKGESWKHVQ